MSKPTRHHKPTPDRRREISKGARARERRWRKALDAELDEVLNRPAPKFPEHAVVD